METLTGSCFMAVLLLALFSSARAKYEAKHFAVGDTLDMDPPEGKTDGLTSILWKYNGNLVAEWVDNLVSLEYYGKFKGRTNLDTESGHLKITSMTAGDAGVYTLETNNRLQVGGYDVKEINKVPEPKLVIRTLTCSSTSESCTLTCEGDTTGAEPVTYSWKGGNGNWKETGKTFTINNTVEIQSAKNLSCRMKNPVSEGESEPIPNPFFQEKSDSGKGWIGGVVFGVVGVLSLVVGVIWYLKPDVIKNLCFKDSAVDQTGRDPENSTQVPLKNTGSPS